MYSIARVPEVFLADIVHFGLILTGNRPPHVGFARSSSIPSPQCFLRQRQKTRVRGFRFLWLGVLEEIRTVYLPI